MVKVLGKSKKNISQQELYRFLDDFILEERKKGISLYRNEGSIDGSYLGPITVFLDETCNKNPAIDLAYYPEEGCYMTVFRKEYFEAAHKVAESLEKKLGIDVLLGEDYLGEGV